MAVSAVTGVLAGRGKRVDLFGVIVLALVTAVGGGTLRDLVLGAPVFWVRDGSFVLTAAGAAVATFVWGRFGSFPYGLLLVADAFGLAFFTTVGTEKALLYGASPAVAIALGVVTGVAGGMIRDILSGEVPLVFRKEIYLYATAAFFGASLLVLLTSAFPGHAFPRLCAIAATLLLRLAAIRWRLSLPLFHLKEESAESLQSSEAGNPDA